MASFLSARLSIYLELLIQREVSYRCGGFRQEEKQRRETGNSPQDFGGGDIGSEECPEGRARGGVDPTLAHDQEHLCV